MAERGRNPRAERPAELRRTAGVSFSLTPGEKERLIAAAHGGGEIVSHFVRRLVMAEVERSERRRK